MAVSGGKRDRGDVARLVVAEARRRGAGGDALEAPVVVEVGARRARVGIGATGDVPRLVVVVVEGAVQAGAAARTLGVGEVVGVVIGVLDASSPVVHRRRAPGEVVYARDVRGRVGVVDRGEPAHAIVAVGDRAVAEGSGRGAGRLLLRLERAVREVGVVPGADRGRLLRHKPVEIGRPAGRMPFRVRSRSEASARVIGVLGVERPRPTRRRWRHLPETVDDVVGEGRLVAVLVRDRGELIERVVLVVDLVRERVGDARSVVRFVVAVCPGVGGCGVAAVGDSGTRIDHRGLAPIVVDPVLRDEPLRALDALELAGRVIGIPPWIAGELTLVLHRLQAVELVVGVRREVSEPVRSLGHVRVGVVLDAGRARVRDVQVLRPVGRAVEGVVGDRRLAAVGMRLASSVASVVVAVRPRPVGGGESGVVSVRFDERLELARVVVVVACLPALGRLDGLQSAVGPVEAAFRTGRAWFGRLPEAVGGVVLVAGDAGG